MQNLSFFLVRYRWNERLSDHMEMFSPRPTSSIKIKCLQTSRWTEGGAISGLPPEGATHSDVRLCLLSFPEKSNWCGNKGRTSCLCSSSGVDVRYSCDTQTWPLGSTWSFKVIGLMAWSTAYRLDVRGWFQTLSRQAVIHQAAFGLSCATYGRHAAMKRSGWHHVPTHTHTWSPVHARLSSQRVQMKGASFTQNDGVESVS